MSYYKNKINIYNDLEFFTCFDADGFYKLSKKLGFEFGEVNLDALNGCIYQDGFKMLIYINLDQRRKNHQVYGTISHESYHLANHIMGLLGMEYKEDSHNEHVAYLIGYITSCVVKNLEKYEEKNL